MQEGIKNGLWVSCFWGCRSTPTIIILLVIIIVYLAKIKNILNNKNK
jgi:hypothetical protein